MKKFILFIILCFLYIAPSYSANETDPTVLYNLGIDCYEQDKIEESISNFKKAIQLDPDFYEAYYNLARVEESADKTQDAIKTYEKLLQIAPEDYESTYQFGEYLYKKGYLSKASSYLSKIPNDSEYKAQADTLLAKITKRQNELASEAQIKAVQNLKSSVVSNVPAPSGLVVDSNGNMFVASFSESKIIKISRDGNTKIVFADKEKGLNGPIGLAIDSNNNIYAANYNKGDIVVFDSKGMGKVLMYAKKPYCISLDEKASKIYVTEQQNNSVLSYDISDILSQGKEAKIEKEVKHEEDKKVIIIPEKDTAPLGTPSIMESPHIKQGPSSSITSPIMVPTSGIF